MNLDQLEVVDLRESSDSDENISSESLESSPRNSQSPQESPQPRKKRRVGWTPLITLLVAHYINGDRSRRVAPYDWLRFAQVNREFYKVFMSDELWARFDWMGQGGTARRYLDSKPQVRRKVLWESPYSYDISRLKTPIHFLVRLLNLTVVHSSDVLSVLDEHSLKLVARNMVPTRPCSYTFEHVRTGFESNSEIVYALLGAGFSPKGLDSQFRHDQRAASAAIDAGRWVRWFKFTDRDVALKAAATCTKKVYGGSGPVLHLLKKFQGDREVVLTSILNDGENLRYATKFSNDREIVFAAAKNGGYIRHASEELREDEEIMEAACVHDTKNLGFSKKLRADAAFVTEIIRENGPFALYYCTPEVYDLVAPIAKNLPHDKEKLFPSKGMNEDHQIGYWQYETHHSEYEDYPSDIDDRKYVGRPAYANSLFGYDY